MKNPSRNSNPQLRSGSSRLLFLPALMTGLCLTVGTLLAGDKGDTKKETKKEVKLDQKKKSESEEKTLITGSLIPQRTKVNRIPVTSSPVIVIGQNDIERSGASTVAEVLKRQGASR